MRVGVPHPRVFCAKSSELLENKRVEFFLNAKNDKRVWKSVKRKDLVCREWCVVGRQRSGKAKRIRWVGVPGAGMFHRAGVEKTQDAERVGLTDQDGLVCLIHSE